MTFHSVPEVLIPHRHLAMGLSRFQLEEAVAQVGATLKYQFKGKITMVDPHA